MVTRNAGPTGEGVKCKKVWVGSDLDHWDVISFNFDAWDTARQASGAGGTPLSEYIQNLKNITEFLMTTKAGKTGMFSQHHQQTLKNVAQLITAALCMDLVPSVAPLSSVSTMMRLNR